MTIVAKSGMVIFPGSCFPSTSTCHKFLPNTKHTYSSRVQSLSLSLSESACVCARACVCMHARVCMFLAVLVQSQCLTDFNYVSVSSRLAILERNSLIYNSSGNIAVSVMLTDSNLPSIRPVVSIDFTHVQHRQEYFEIVEVCIIQQFKKMY